MVKIDFNEEADEDSPKLLMLRKFEWIAGFAAELARQELPDGPDTAQAAAARRAAEHLHAEHRRLARQTESPQHGRHG